MIHRWRGDFRIWTILKKLVRKDGILILQKLTMIKILNQDFFDVKKWLGPATFLLSDLKNKLSVHCGFP
jgi:hypothetical protein